MNELSNDVFKAIVINFEPFVNEVLSYQIPKYSERVKDSPCVLETRERGQLLPNQQPPPSNCDDDYNSALDYITRLQQLLTTGIAGNTAPALTGIYEVGYKRLVAQLKDAGCRFTEGRPIPTDYNICLSLIDIKRMSTAPEGILIESRTSELNSISNIVSRATLYSGPIEKQLIATSLDDILDEYANIWTKGDMNSQEVLYLKALILFMREGLAATEPAIFSSDVLSPQVRDSAVSGGIGHITINQPPLRLYESYRNAFERVIEICVTEVASSRGSVSGNEDAFMSFINWEQGLRRNLTNDLWTLNPAELVGDWQLADVVGMGSLNSLMTIPTNSLIDNLSQGFRINLDKDGQVEMKNTKYGVGLNWYFRPGPAHLDTCEFYVSTTEDPDFVLKYVGFIDRGQRIESRFSRSPIRMTGRVISMLRGEILGSSRFVLLKERSTI